MYLYTIVSVQYVKCVVCDVQGKYYAAYAVKLLTAFYQSVVCAGVRAPHGIVPFKLFKVAVNSVHVHLCTFYAMFKV